MKTYINRKWMCILTAAALTATIFTGCSDERLEDELAYRTIGINSMEAGAYEDAAKAFESALAKHVGRIGQTEIDICYYKAAAQYAAGDLDGAIGTYEDLLAYDSKDGNAYYMKGCVLLQKGDMEGAFSDFANAVQCHADDYELYVNIYENLAAYNLTEQGEEYLNEAFDIKGAEAEDLAWRGKIYAMLGEYDNAITELKAALEKESAVANLYLAQVYEAQGDTENAEKYYCAYVDSGAVDSIAFNALAEIEIGKGNYVGALDYVNQGLSMDNVPNKKALLQNQIIASEYMGDFATAWATIQEYIVLYPDDAAAQREYTFLKNRQGALEIPGEVVVPEEGTEAAEETEVPSEDSGDSQTAE